MTANILVGFIMPKNYNHAFLPNPQKIWDISRKYAYTSPYNEISASALSNGEGSFQESSGLYSEQKTPIAGMKGPDLLVTKL